MKPFSSLLTTLFDNLKYSKNGDLSVQFVVGPHVGLEGMNSIQNFTNRFNANNFLVSDIKGIKND